MGTPTELPPASWLRRRCSLSARWVACLSIAGNGLWMVLLLGLQKLDMEVTKIILAKVLSFCKLSSHNIEFIEILRS
jgi:hypothetical protein